MDIDLNRNSELLDRGPEVISPPPPEFVRNRDPELYLNRLDAIGSPNERLGQFFVSIFDLSGTGTHEGDYVRQVAVHGTMFGWIFGGLMKLSGHHEEFVRRHNAAVFENRHQAHRLMFDQYVYRFITQGARTGLAVGLLTSSAAIISLGSINYRNKLYFPDWFLGFTTLGAVTRCWLGLRGLVAGAAFGSAAGLLGYACARSFEVVTGETITYMRTIHHLEWKQKREARLLTLQASRADSGRAVES